MHNFKQFLQEKLLMINKGAREGQVVFLAGGAGCLEKDTPVIMSDGSLKMSQDIESGDMVMGPDSKPRTVGELHTGKQEMLRVTSTKGDTYTCNRQHIHCFVCSFSKCGFIKNQQYNMTYDEWLLLPDSAKQCLKIYKTGLDFKYNTVPVDPYVVGLWLGDGCYCNTSIVIDNKQTEIVQYMKSVLNEDGYEFNTIKSDKENASVYTITHPAAKKSNPIRSYLTTHCYNGYEKRIPVEYLRNSLSVRKSVLAGLIDSDGYNGGGYYEIITKFNGLKDDIYYLASSLGYQVNVSNKTVEWNGEDRHYHRLSISGSFEDLPIQCPYKKCKPRKQIKNVLRQGYSFELLPEDDYYGFSIVEDDKRFLLGNFVVTHNSGKGFAITHFLEGNKYKIINVDDWKLLYLKLPEKYSELKNLDLRTPEDVYKLHMFVKTKGIKSKAIANLVRDTSTTTPNILFDVTLKNADEIFEIVPFLTTRGYKKENIHIIWVLTDYDIAVKQNRSRSRVVPDDILLQTHEGAAKTMHGMIYKNQYPTSLMNGGVWVILNGPKHTVLWNPDTASKTGNFVIRDFKYLTVKKPGKPIDSEGASMQLYQWIKDNVPKTRETREIFSEELILLGEGALMDLIKKHTDPYKFAEEAMRMIAKNELKLKDRGASNARELIGLFYKHKRA